MTAGDAVDVVRPGDLAQAREAMLDAGRNRTLVIRGGGSKAEWGAPAVRHDVTVETTALSRIVAHDPADATARVQAGLRLADLQTALAASGQWLAIDPPHAAATVGGIFAANDTGPRRLRYGSMRDLVIGMTMVTTDGAVARSGGNVIKNVAGYDLAKLLCGSLGTLGLVVELVLRLHPVPEATATVTADIDPVTATRAALDILASPHAVSAIDWVAGRLAIRIEGRSRGVAAQIRGVTDVLARHDTAATVVAGAEDHTLWDRVAEGHAGRDGETVARAATVPSEFGRAAAAFDATCAATGISGELASHVGNGLHTARWREDDVESTSRAVSDWRRRIGDLGGHVVVRRRRHDLTDTDTIWGPPGPAVGVMGAVKKQFDPAGRCAPGRYVGGI